MVVLKRIKSSTLMETLVATVLIVIIFMISSLLLNNILSNTIKGRSHHIMERLQQLKYEYSHTAFKAPYYEDLNDWELSITATVEKGMDIVIFKAENQKDKKVITTRIVNEE